LAAVKVSGSKKQKLKLKIENFQNRIILILLISSVFCDIKNEQGGQGGQPLALEWFTVSKVPKISELWFVYGSTKKWILGDWVVRGGLWQLIGG